MVFTCHAISDGDFYNSKTIGWAVAGQGKVYIAPFMTSAQDLAKLEFPNAEFKMSYGIDHGQEYLLKSKNAE